MPKTELEELFKFLKEVTQNIDELKNGLNELKTQWGIAQIKLDVLDKKFDEVKQTTNETIKTIKQKCETHDEKLKQTSDFILVHDTQAKSFLGLRGDVIAWLTLVGLIITISVNIYNFNNNKIINIKNEKLISNK